MESGLGPVHPQKNHNRNLSADLLELLESSLEQMKTDFGSYPKATRNGAHEC